MAKVESRIEKQAAGATIQDTATLKGKLVEYLWYLKKQGYRKSTIESRVQRIKRLIRLGADLFDPESVKKIISNDEWTDNYKANLVQAYNSFIEMVDLN